jgi:hypothetical protein
MFMCNARNIQTPATEQRLAQARHVVVLHCEGISNLLRWLTGLWVAILAGGISTGKHGSSVCLGIALHGMYPQGYQRELHMPQGTISWQNNVQITQGMLLLTCG